MVPSPVRFRPAPPGEPVAREAAGRGPGGREGSDVAERQDTEQDAEQNAGSSGRPDRDTHEKNYGKRDLAAMRETYARGGLAESDLAPDWPTQFDRWLDDTVAAGLPEPNAMVVGTASADGVPATRTVLCKGVDERGIVFYTNLESDKSRDLKANPWASATFPWHGLQRQVHVRGPVVRVSDAETVAYWNSRPQGSKVGAWASPQSRVLSGRDELEQLQRQVEERFFPMSRGERASGGPPGARGAERASGERPAPHRDERPDGPSPEVPLPPFWGGWRIEPRTVEFWQGRVGRLHDRLRYRRTDDGSWVVERLAP